MDIAKNIINRKIIIRYDSNVVDQPIVYRLAKDFDLVPNILQAKIDPDKKGFLVLAITGYAQDYKEGLAYMRSLGLEVKHLAEHVEWDKDKCTQCGLCTGLCPTHALYLERPAQSVHFSAEKCVMCNICLKACPVKAVHIHN